MGRRCNWIEDDIDQINFEEHWEKIEYKPLELSDMQMIATE